MTGKHIKFVESSLLVLLIMAIVSAPAVAVPVRTVIMSGEHAPGTELTASFTSIFADASLNGSGRVAFRAKLVGPGIGYQVRDYGLWSEGQGGLGLIARTGDPCPGAPVGTQFHSFSNSVLNGAGQVAFEPFAKNGGTFVYTIYSATVGSPNLITRNTLQAPDAPLGWTFATYNYQTHMAFNDSGQAAFTGRMQGAGANQFNYNGVWVMGGGASRSVALADTHPPEAPAGWNLWRFSAPYINAAGNTAFQANMWNGSLGGKQAIWSDVGGSLGLVAMVGQQAPHLPSGVTFSQIPFEMGFNNAGQVAFQGKVTGPGVGFFNEQGIWVGKSYSDLVLAARDGDPAPGTGGGFFSGIRYTTPSVNSAGQVAFHANVYGSNDYGVWTGKPGSLNLVAREGWQVPGLPPGVQYDYLSAPALNGAGAVAFTSTLRGTGVTTANNYGLLATANGQPVVVHRTGDVVEVRPGVFKTISGFGHFDRVGTESGSPSSFNDMGQLAYQLSFTDSTSGMFVASITGGGPGSLDNPVVPDNIVPGLRGEWVFDNVSGEGQWFDPPTAEGYLYETNGLSNFTQVILPGTVGDADGLFTIIDSVNGTVTVPAGALHAFPTAVDRFTVLGIDPGVDGGDPLAFPTFLAFDQTTVSFTQTPIPEPATVLLLAFGGVAVLKRRAGR
ncbi:MAG: PEP-CTERM sorting domain-containing protein [Phycisphaerae bacterium]|nr:PEP-CTERM sorting domain-containing protein [Phycisphaerae bacterium]